MSHKITQLPEPIDAGLGRVETRIRGRRHANDLATLILPADLADPHFMQALVEVFQDLGGLKPPPPPPPPDQPPPPIARLGATRMLFGQYLGQTLDDVPTHYLDWLVQEQEDFYRDLRAYLKHPDLESRRRGIDA